MEREKDFLSRYLSGLIPDNNSIVKIAWNSPNDGKGNLVNFLMDLEPYTIRIKDNH